MIDVTDIKGIGPAKADTLAENGYETVEEIAEADREELASVDGVGEDRALEFMVGASDLLEAEVESQDDSEQSEEESDEFDLTPSEVSEELEEMEEEEGDDNSDTNGDSDESSDESESSEEPQEEVDPTYDVSLSFQNKFVYDVYHAALMRHHERVYTSYQPAADAMQKFLDQLNDFESVQYELTEFELNTLHTAIKQVRTDYQGDNMIDHMDALKTVESQIDEARRENLF